MTQSSRVLGLCPLWVLGALFALIGTATFAPQFPQPALAGPVSPAQKASTFRVLESDTEHLIVELNTSPDQIEIKPGPEGCALIALPGYGQIADVGQPLLPLKGALLGIPPEGEVVVRILEMETLALDGRYDICPAPGLLFADSADGLPHETGESYVRNAIAYAQNALYPAVVADLANQGYIRSQRIGRLQVIPFQYDPVKKLLFLHPRVTVELRFPTTGNPLGSTVGALPPDSSSFEQLLQNLLLNYEPAKRWRDKTDIGLGHIGLARPSAEQSFKISIEASGIYELDYDDLIAAGIDINALDPRKLHLYCQGREVAISVIGEDDGHFDRQDSIEFYAEPADTKYTRTNIYWLTIENTHALRMQQRDGGLLSAAPTASSYLASLHFEQDHIYWPAPTPTIGRDYWFWTRLYATESPVYADFPLNLPQIIVGPYTSTLRIGVKSRLDTPAVDPDHHLRVYFNDIMVSDTRWNGEQTRLIEAKIRQTSLSPNTQTLRLELPRDLQAKYDALYLDWIELDYYRTYTSENDLLVWSNSDPGNWNYQIEGFTSSEIEVYDISDALQPMRIVDTRVDRAEGGYTLRFGAVTQTPRRFLCTVSDLKRKPAQLQPAKSSTLRAIQNKADYIIITHGDILTATLPIARYRAEQGLETMVVDVETIYDEFSNGVFNPEAIRDFLAYSYANWQPPAPSYVLLVGDGSLDFRDNLHTGEKNLVPPFLAQVDPWLGETVSDNRYVAVSGDDRLPDMHIGRLPVSNPDEVNAMAAKIIAYEQEAPLGAWRHQTLFIADDADVAGDFPKLSDNLIGLLPPEFAANRIYYGITHFTPATTEAAIVQALNSGYLLVNYVGHASIQAWAAEQLFGLRDLSSLSVTGRLPIMLPWTCYEGLFAYPAYPSLGESIVRAPDRGAVASWSPSGLGVASGHDQLANKLYQALFSDHVTQLGPATTQAKVAYWAQSQGSNELVDTYLLFGDPALHVPFASPRLIYLPMVTKPS